MEETPDELQVGHHLHFVRYVDVKTIHGSV
jgi:hypothetical protein